MQRLLANCQTLLEFWPAAGATDISGQRDALPIGACDHKPPDCLSWRGEAEYSDSRAPVPRWYENLQSLCPINLIAAEAGVGQTGHQPQFRRPRREHAAHAEHTAQE
jgi:hypothetical protein